MFFLGRSDGVGIDRDMFGRTIRRCTIRAEGAPHATISAICVNEILTYDDGEIQNWRWVLSRSADGRYVVAEAQAGSGHVVERRADGDFVVSFLRTRGMFSQRHVTRYAMLTTNVALETTNVSFLGVPQLMFTAVRRRLHATVIGAGSTA
jgi:hypothetical protein